LAVSLQAQVIITEFLSDPKAPLESEWVELYNLSDQGVNLAGWFLCDQVGCAKIDSLSIEPGEYAILCQDSISFLSYYDLPENDFHQIGGWRSLNNDGDLIALKNPDDLAIDSIIYMAGNGGNISWERMDYAVPGWDSQNWYPCLDSMGSTPGRENSVANGFAEDFELRLAKKVFAPGSGGEDQYLRMEIKMPRDCNLTLTVYSLDGRKILTIYDQKMLVSGEYLYDGHDADGIFLDTGMYLLLVQAGGACSYSEKYVFGVAKR